jgi:Putative Ig domain
MKRTRHHHGAADRQGILGGFVSSVRAKLGQGGAHSWRPKHVKAEDGHIRRLRSPIVLFVCAFVFASGTAAFAYTMAPGSGTGHAQAVTLNSPGAGSASKPTTTSVSLSWEASSELPPGGGYLVLRSTSSGGPYSKVSSGTCNQVITLVSAVTSCTDTGLTAGTTYFYEVEAAYYNLSTLWVSAPDSQFSGTTSQPPVNPGTTGQAPAITSASSTSFFVGSAGSFHATASGSPAPTFSNTAFSGCTPSILPSGVTFSSNGLLSGTPGSGAVGTYTVCINAANGVSPNTTQKFTLSIDTETLVISSGAVSGATSSTPNLGPITVRRQTGSGTPITTGGALTVNLTSSPSSGATFGLSQFASAPVTSMTIPSGQSTATFWYGLTTTGGPTITASATNYVSGTQLETITTAPAGLGMALATGSTGSPVISCGLPSASYTCHVTGVGTSGNLVFSVTFWNSGKSPVVYSATQASTVNDSAHSTAGVTINANATGSSPDGVTAPLGTSTLTFGPYTLTVNVSS